MTAVAVAPKAASVGRCDYLGADLAHYEDPPEWISKDPASERPRDFLKQIIEAEKP